MMTHAREKIATLTNDSGVWLSGIKSKGVQAIVQKGDGMAGLALVFINPGGCISI